MRHAVGGGGREKEACSRRRGRGREGEEGII